MEPCEAMELCGFEEEKYHLRDVAFQNIRIAAAEGAECGDDGIHTQYCENVTFENVKSGFAGELR